MSKESNEAGLVCLTRAAMGTRFQAFLSGPDPDYLRDAGNQALDEVERLEEALSHYRQDSDICDLNHRAPHGPVRLEPGLLALLVRAVELSEATEGAFDPTAGALVRCWGFFRGQGRMPDEAAVREALEVTGTRHLELDRNNRTVRFRREGVQVHLGAVGKGYAIDRMVEVLRELRVDAALLHGGTSTVYGLGAAPGADAWEVGLCDPVDRSRRLGVVRLRDRALSTSGDYEQFFEWEGRRYSHILDPRTGWPAQGVRSATVVGSSAADTDALSTGAFVLGAVGAARLCGKFPEIGVVLAPDSDPDTGSEALPELLVQGDIVLLPAPDAGDDGGSPEAPRRN